MTGINLKNSCRQLVAIGWVLGVNVFIITWTSGDYGLGRPMMSLVQTDVIFYVQSREIHLRTVLRVVRFMVFNTTFNNISVISCLSDLLVEETGENHHHVASK